VIWDWLVAWRAELLTGVIFAVSWVAISRLWHKPFWSLVFAGMLTGLCVEYMTEPAWTYFMQFYIWRDISPFVVIGWGINLTWVVLLSEKLCSIFFGKHAGMRGDKRLFLTDVLIGVPYFLGSELIGLHVLKVWQYNENLRWNTILPVLHYPLEGVVAILFFSLAFPWMVRYWQPENTA